MAADIALKVPARPHPIDADATDNPSRAGAPRAAVGVVAPTSSPSPTIRLAEPRDAVAILDCIRGMVDEFAVKFPPVQDVPALHKIIHTIASGFVVVAEYGGKVIGSLGIEAKQQWWNADAWLLADNWFYVHPDHRKGRLAVALIREAQRKADTLGAAPMLLGLVSGVDPESKDRFVQMLGLQYCGGIFAHGLRKE